MWTRAFFHHPLFKHIFFALSINILNNSRGFLKSVAAQIDHCLRLPHQLLFFSKGSLHPTCLPCTTTGSASSPPRSSEKSSAFSLASTPFPAPPTPAPVSDWSPPRALECWTFRISVTRSLTTRSSAPLTDSAC